MEYTFRGRKVVVNETLAEVMPDLDELNDTELRASLEHDGFNPDISKIQLWISGENEEIAYVVDGHNRLRICEELGIELTDEDFTLKEFDSINDATEYMFHNQMSRRNMTELQRFEYAEQYLRENVEKEAKRNQQSGGLISSDQRVDSRQILAETVGISKTKYGYYRAVLNSRDEELISDLRTGELTASGAYNMLQEKKEAKVKGVIAKTKAEIKPQKTSRRKWMELELKKEKLSQQQVQLINEAIQNYKETGISLIDFERVNTHPDSVGKFINWNFFIKSDEEKKYIYTEGRLESEFPSENALDKIDEDYRFDFCVAWKRAYEDEQQIPDAV